MVSGEISATLTGLQFFDCCIVFGLPSRFERRTVIGHSGKTLLTAWRPTIIVSNSPCSFFWGSQHITPFYNAYVVDPLSILGDHSTSGHDDRCLVTLWLACFVVCWHICRSGLCSELRNDSVRRCIPWNQSSLSFKNERRVTVKNQFQKVIAHLACQWLLLRAHISKMQ